MSHRSFQLVLVALLAAAPAAARSQDVADLVGIRPGEALTPVKTNKSVAESPAPFVFFGIPTLLPALAAIFPSGELYALKDGVVVGVRWERTYSTEQECQVAVEAARVSLRPYFPGAVTGDDAWRYQIQSNDGAQGVGFSCRPNEGGYHRAMVELVHFASDKQLAQLMRTR